MSIPEIVFTVADNALGLLGPSDEQTYLAMGVASYPSTSTVITDQLYTISDIGTMQSTFVGGELVEAVALALTTSNCTALCMALPASYSETLGNGTNLNTSSTGPALATASGTPNGAYNISVQVITAGHTIAAGGCVVLATINGVVGANYVLPAGGAFVLSSANTGLTYTTGLTWTFGSGTPVVGDIYSGYAYINTSAVTTTSAAGTLAISNAANYSGPADEYNATITVVTGGLYSAGTMVITYSLDGNTVSNPIAIPITGTYTIPNTGLLLTFGGTTVAGDTFNFSTVPPTFTLASLATAWTTVLNSNQLFRFAHIIGGPTQSVYASAALQQAMDSHLTAAFNQNIFTRAIIQCPTDTDIDITTGFENAFSKRVSTAVGQTGTISPITGYIEERSVAWTATARAIGTPISTKLGAVAMGPIEGITSISYNAQKDSTLATSQPPFITTRTLPGAGGFYFTNGPLQSALPSDFVDLVYGFVIDEACTLTYAALLQYLNGNVRVNSNGTIFAPDAAAINAAVSSAITDVLCGTANPFGTPNASAVSATVNTNANILSTSTLPVTIRVTPFGYNSSITVNISFYNPALNIQVAA